MARLGDLVQTSADVAETSGKLAKVGRLADLLRRVAPEEIEAAVAFLSGRIRQGRIGIGHAAIAAGSDVPAADASSLTLQEVDAAFSDMARIAGAGATGARGESLRALFARATAAEQDFLRRLLYGELRQGALEGVLIEAVARASAIPAARVRRAAMLAGDLKPAARAALTGDLAALDGFAVQLMRPVQPMLADSAASVADALDDIEDASLEYKLDGARIQVHKDGDEVRIFSRTLRDVTAAIPEVVSIVRALPARDLILDGEAIALRPDGRPQPFQVTMSRFGRKPHAGSARRSAEVETGAPRLTPFFFDCLHAQGAALIDEPQERRLAALGEIAPAVAVPRVVRPTLAQAQAFAGEALARGHEGVMAKSLAAPYAAGRRGSAWLKIKQARALDLVVLAAEWGHGRRRGWLSNLHLGARDPERNGFVMLGKTFKGLTDERLAWQTERLLGLEIGRDAYTVFVRPELVVEIAFNEIQRSPIYPGQLALRFARVLRYRDDKTAADADTIDTVRGLANLDNASEV